ncbi:MAG TPA: hypothetical protein VIR58_02695 [Acidimicrobiales bacterium]
MNEIRVLKRVVILLAAWTSLVLGVSTALDDGALAPAQAPPAAVSGSSEPGTARPVPSAPARSVATAPALQQSSSVDGHDTLQQDALMTQRMAAPNAAGPMFTGQVQDDQLLHSQNPAFVQALEEHQADIDRMLARPER